MEKSTDDIRALQQEAKGRRLKSLSLNLSVLHLRKQSLEFGIGLLHRKKPSPTNTHDAVIDSRHGPDLRLLQSPVSVEHLHQETTPGTSVPLSQ